MGTEAKRPKRLANLFSGKGYCVKNDDEREEKTEGKGEIRDGGIRADGIMGRSIYLVWRNGFLASRNSVRLTVCSNLSRIISRHFNRKKPLNPNEVNGGDLNFSGIRV